MSKNDLARAFATRLMSGTKLWYSKAHVNALALELEACVYYETLDKMYEYLIEHDKSLKSEDEYKNETVDS